MKLKGVLVGTLLVLCSALLALVTLYYSSSSDREFLAFLRVYVVIINLIIAFIIAWIGLSTIIASRASQDIP